MSPPPTSIDGTDITGATIDGQEVQEITVDGQTVFTADALPVAYSNLIAWYPFDSSFYGGANGDDCTALFNPGESGDSTAYDGTEVGVIHRASGGVTDINAGPNSGAYEFFGGGEHIDLPVLGFAGSQDISVTLWFNMRDISQDTTFFYFGDDSTNNMFLFATINQSLEVAFFENDFLKSHNFVDNTWHHVAATFDSSTNELNVYTDGSLFGTQTMGTPSWNDNDYAIGQWDRQNRPPEGFMEDIRVYDSVLTTAEVNEIYTNTDI